MTNQSGFERLSPELFNNVLSHFPLLKDQLPMTLVSKTLYQKSTAHIYQEWKFHGYVHSFKSLHLFLRSVILNPRLASQVQTLDIREWGKKPVEWSNKKVEYAGNRYRNSVKISRHSVEEEDPESQNNKPQSNIPPEISEEEAQRQADIENAKYDEGIPIFINAVSELKLNQDRVEWFSTWTTKRDPDILLALLITKLPNLKTLNITLPVRDWESEEEQSEGVISILEEFGSSKSSTALQNLETISVCSAMEVGIKGHRQYDFELERTLPFFKINNLSSLHILTATGFNGFDPGFVSRSITPMLKTSNITSLAFEGSQAPPRDIVQMLSIPKELKTLRWSQSFSCFSIGSCTTPFYAELREGLSQHEKTLEKLDFDFTALECKNKGHAGNPYAKREDMMANVRDTWRDDCHLLGSLKEFTSLRSLKIGADSLCGNNSRGISPSHMAELLPSSIEELNFSYELSFDEKTRQSQREDQIWVDELVHLARNFAVTVPRLQKISLETQVQRLTPEENDRLFDPVELACKESGIIFRRFEHTTKSDWQTENPYFLEVLPTRNPGRDW